MDQAKAQSAGDQRPDKLFVQLAFGCATSDFITCSDYFVDNLEDIHLFSQNESSIPREKLSGAKISLDSSTFPPPS